MEILKAVEDHTQRIPTSNSAEVTENGDQSPLNGSKAKLLHSYYCDQGLYFHPGSLSSFSQAVTLGLWDEVQNYLRKAGSAEAARELIQRRSFGDMRFNPLHLVVIGKQRIGVRIGHDNSYGEQDFLRTARKLLENKADVNARDLIGNTPLHLATSINPQLDLSSLLIELGADVNARNRIGRVPLHEATMLGHTAICKLLIESGANPRMKDNDGISPMDLASGNGPSEEPKERFSQEGYTLQGNAMCNFCQKGREMANLSRCKSCLSVFYCGKECQVADWKLHKLQCANTQNNSIAKVDLKDKFMGHPCTVVPMSSLVTQGLTTEVEFSGLSYPSDPATKRGKTFIVKVQLCLGSYGGPMMCYDKTRNFQSIIESSNADYGKLYNIIESQGVQGLKGYFNASLDKKGKLQVMTSEMMPPQPW